MIRAGEHLLSRLHTFFKTNFTYKGAVCPIAERRHLSWWQENVNGPLEQVITAERRQGIAFNYRSKKSIGNAKQPW